MGQRLIALAAADPELQIVGALESASHPRSGQDAGQVAGVEPIGVPISSQLKVPADVLIDFSVPAAANAVTTLCSDREIALVMATTGLDEDQHEALRDAATRIPVLWAPSMSSTVNLAMKLTEIAAGALKDHPGGVDVEILERHHRFKEDAPSGTALKFGQIVADQMGQTAQRHGREGQVGARPANEIGYHAIRVGDNPGEHTIVFGLLGETIELRVAATNRDAYASGALAAAKFLTGKPPGMFTMNDVLGL